MLDEASAALVHQLASTATAFLVMTIRSGEPVPDPILALWKDGLAEYLELQPLPEADVQRLVAAVLAGEVDRATQLRLWEATRGSALFLRELVVQELERGALRNQGGLWRWTGSIEPGARLAEIVGSRVGKLAAAERDTLELVAFGEPIGIGLVERLGPVDSLDQLQRRDLLSLEHSGKRLDLRLAHPLYGEVLRARTPSPHAIVARLAEALEATGARRREDLLRLASWRLEAGASGPPELLVSAAWRALASFDPALAERLAAAAVDAGGELPARHVLGLALLGQGRFAEADAVLAQLDAVAHGDAERALVADARATSLFWGLGMASEAEQVLVAAEAQVGNRDLRDELTAVRGALLVFAGRPAAALAAVRPILDSEEATERARARAGLAAVTALCLAGGVEQARTLVERLREPAILLAYELPFLPSQLLAAYSLALTLAGRLDDAEAEAREGYERALADHAHDASALWAKMLGRVHLARGAVRTACTLLQEAAAKFAELDAIGFGALCLAFLSHARALAADRHGAEQALARAEATLRPGTHIFDADLGIARAWTVAAGGERSAARTQALRVADDAQASGQLAYAAVALHDLARLGDAASATERITELADRLDGPLAQAYAAHAAASAARDGGALDDAAAAFESTGALLLAAEAFTEASAAHRDRGRPGSAARSATRANLLAERCEGAVTPALLDAGGAAALTRRESEVASLAASGLSNRAIAERLVVSVRTVEHHLEHAYQKLGVTGRGQLAPLLQRPRARV